MKISEVEAAVGVTKKNIRFYEEEGLISPRKRGSSAPGGSLATATAVTRKRMSSVCGASNCCANWMCRWLRSGRCWRESARWLRE